MSAREQLLAEAIRVLTAAARLTRPMLQRAAIGDGSAYEWVESGHREPDDWAEFVAQALAGAAANVGSIERALAGRPGSWEADFVRQLLAGTVGHDGEYLLEHRTEPVVVDVYVDELLVDLGAWKAYDDAQQELGRRYDAIDIPTVTGVPGDPAVEAALEQLAPAMEEQERLAEEIGRLEDRLEQQREDDWAAYGEALKAAIEAAAARRPSLRVPVVVNVDLDSFRPSDQRGQDEVAWGVEQQLLMEAIQAVPLPGGGRTPLQRLQAADDGGPTS